MSTSAVRDPEGQLTTSLEETLACWQGHFTRLLNVTSAYDDQVIECMPSRPVRRELDDVPTFDELVQALRRLSCGKASGRSGISPEILVYGGPALHHQIFCLFCRVWECGVVPGDWRDADIVPIPKKGDLSSCDNWRGISLLDVVGKLFARLLNDRLQSLAEDVLPDSQCGFRKGRGCTDMIFVARQLIEKSVEHASELYVLFVDQKKAYDSIPRSALRIVLQKLGVPPRMCGLVQSLHDGMEARVRVDGSVTESILVKNGLRQGCTLAPTLFSLYFSAVMADWRSSSSVPGVQVRYRVRRKLVGDRTRKSRLAEMSLTESQFADDAALYVTSWSDLQVVSGEFAACASRWGLTVSLQKTKAMAVNCAGALPVDVPVGERGAFGIVSQFTYLGSVLTNDGSLDVEVGVRLAKASRAFGAMLRPIFLCSALSLDIKRMVYRSVVLSVLLYGSETWTIKARQLHRLNIFHRSCVRAILVVSRTAQCVERLTNIELARRFGMSEDMAVLLRQRRMRWLGHMARMDDDRAPKCVLFGELPATRPRHGPKRRWRDIVLNDLERLGVDKTWCGLAQVRNQWRQQCVRGRPSPPQLTRTLACELCGRLFRRPGDLKRHQNFCTA